MSAVQQYLALVAIPTFNGSGTIEEAMSSVLDSVELYRRDTSCQEPIALSVVGTQAVISALFDLLRSRDLAIENLHTHRPTLEDVFMALTGKHIRDE